jgi:hypothetical protein
MKWILDHLQILIAVAAAFAYWLNQRKQEKAEEGETHADTRGEFAPPAHVDLEEAERTRRIQDEIRRKIAERASGGPINVPPPALEPPPIFQRDTMAPRPVASPLPQQWERAREHEVWREEQPHTFTAAENAALERQRELDEQLSALAEAKRVTQRKVAALAATEQAAAAHASPARGDLLADLRGARNLRRAMVLREVLGPPVALR